jgi:hypothetical protein
MDAAGAAVGVTHESFTRRIRLSTILNTQRSAFTFNFFPAVQARAPAPSRKMA